MSNKIKAAIVVLVTLVIGIILGFVMSSYHYHHRVDKFKGWCNKEGFVQNVEQHLDLSEKQRSEVLPIIEKYAKKTFEMHNDCRKQHSSIINSMYQELESHLNENQMEKLEHNLNCGNNCKKNRHVME